MGKSKNRKYKMKPNPTGIPSVKELEAEELEFDMTVSNGHTGTVDDVVEKLQSTNLDDRVCGAIIIANQANDASFISTLIENRVLRVAAPLLVDKNLAVRHAIAGSLRNVAVCGDYLVSEAMIEQDIMTSMIALLQEYATPWAPQQKTDKTNDSISEIFLEVCNLLWNLCSNSEKAVGIFNQTNLVNILLPSLNTDTYGYDIPLAVAHCLVTVTENNEVLTETLRQALSEAHLKTLMTLPSAEPQQLMLKNLAAGLKLNLFSGKLDSCMTDVVSSILEVVLSTLNVPIGPPLEFLSKLIVSLKLEKANKHHEENDLEEKYTAACQAEKAFSHLLEAKQMSLEMLGNIFDDTEDCDEKWEDISSDSVSDASDVAEMDVDESVSPNEIGLGIASETRQIVINGNFLVKITEQIALPSEQALQILKADARASNCLKKLDSVICTALLCMSNVIQKLTVSDFGGSNQLLDTWVNLANLLLKKSDAELVEAITRCMSTIVRKLAEGECPPHFRKMTDSDLGMLIEICRTSTHSMTRVHVIRILGTVGCLLVKQPSPHASEGLVKIIVSFLLETSSKNSDVLVIAESLDTMFDIFANDFTFAPKIASDLCLADKLTQIHKHVIAKIKQQRKELKGEHLSVIQTVRDNLQPFIRFIKKQVAEV